MTAHPDHAGFAERARTDAGAQVWIHQADAETARTGKPEERRQHVLLYLLRNAFYRTAFSLARRGAVKIIPVKEVSSFADGEVIDVPGSPRALHTPGHTPGSAAIAVEKRNALLAGDAMCTWNPYTGRVGPQIMPSALNMSSAQAMATRIGVQPGQLTVDPACSPNQRGPRRGSLGHRPHPNPGLSPWDRWRYPPTTVPTGPESRRHHGSRAARCGRCGRRYAGPGFGAFTPSPRPRPNRARRVRPRRIRLWQLRPWPARSRKPRLDCGRAADPGWPPRRWR